MGFGKRPETYNKEKLRGPSPETYNLKSSFDSPLQNISDISGAFSARKKTFCFGAGREDLQIKKNLNAPGPGTYKDKSRDCGVNARKFSIQGRNMYLDSSQMAKKKGVPGPGSYMDQTALSPLGNYSISEYVNSRAARINTGRRFQSHLNMVPGPGTYEEVGRVA